MIIIGVFRAYTQSKTYQKLALIITYTQQSTYNRSGLELKCSNLRPRTTKRNVRKNLPDTAEQTNTISHKISVVNTLSYVQHKTSLHNKMEDTRRQQQGHGELGDMSMLGPYPITLSYDKPRFTDQSRRAISSADLLKSKCGLQ